MRFNKELLIELIKSNGVSLRSLGRDININHSTLSFLVRGESANPHPDTVNALANYFKITPDKLFIDEGIEKYKELRQAKSTKAGSLAETLKYLMQHSGIINSSQLYRYTGISVPTIDRILNGDTESPNPNTLVAFAKFFDITISQLQGDEHIPEGKLFNIIKAQVAIPLIAIHDAIPWIDTGNKSLIKKYLNAELVTLSEKSFAIINQINAKISHIHFIDPSLKPNIADTVIAYNDKTIGIFEYLNESTLISSNFTRIAKNDYIIIGISVLKVIKRN